MTKKKICPLRVKGNFDCLEKYCAWWIPKAKQCCVRALPIAVINLMKLMDFFVETKKQNGLSP